MTIPKLNVGIVRGWDTMRLCLEKKKKGKDKTMATSAELEDFSESFDREFGFIALESTNAG